MLLQVYFVQYFYVISASNLLYKSNFETDYQEDEDQPKGNWTLARYKRDDPEDGFGESPPTCAHMGNTQSSPFIVLLLYQTSGRYTGMGSIIDQRTVLTAALAIGPAIRRPNSLLVMAGRRSPWWGKNSQIRTGREIVVNDAGLALIKLQDQFLFSRSVLPIKLATTAIPHYAYRTEFSKTWAIYGIPRSAWEVQGEFTPKTSIYIMKLENMPPTDVDCLHAFPDMAFNESTMACTIANGTFCWGCIGSPTVAITKNEKVVQIAVVGKTTFSEKDDYHYHIKLAPFQQWLRAHSLVEKT